MSLGARDTGLEFAGSDFLLVGVIVSDVAAMRERQGKKGRGIHVPCSGRGRVRSFALSPPSLVDDNGDELCWANTHLGKCEIPGLARG